MNEGKPTKAKWWSRPRPPVPPGDAGGTGSSEDVRTAEGDFELDRPLGGGDFAGAGAGVDGDFELDKPAPSSQEGAALGGAGVDSTEPRVNAEGDFELARPAAPAHHDSESDGIRAVPPADLSDTPSAGLPAAPADGLPAATPTPLPSDAVPADQPPADRPRPLHDPDPYSTPPYGEPGPWAPAPPVQHPVATPAHGTHVPAATPTQDTHVPPAPAAFTQSPGHQPPATPSPWQRYDPWAAPAPLQQNGAAVATKAQRRKRANKVLVLGAVVIALVSGGVGGGVGAYLERNGGGSDIELPQAGREAPERAPGSVAGIAAQALPSVVTLHVSGSEEEATGTGFVLDGQGHILTNNHVVEPAVGSGEISVTFSSGDTAKAKVVGRDSGYDLAVVRVTGVSGLDPMPLGNSDSVQVGDPVVAIGAPFDLANTVTSGIISAKERPITAGGESDGSDVSYVDALQTDAPINPGNSGGPLLDSKARVIGINSAIRSADSGSGLESGQSGSIGLGFAIPINQGKRVAEELINTGKATHPVIGVTLDMDYTGDGAKVGTQSGDGGPAVTEGGPGAKAGIEEGDVITEIDGRPVHSGEELIVKTRAHRPGDTLRLTVLRGGTEKQITLVLGSADSN
ncbi:trypsin-like peptidase domain-containing protein [Streptomyces sp. NBC_00038]|uniref:trypsin-like peptidase domain-containing protein n=1 Tax=Streptomyces sp. NBC_00038 TaxID=2903615 RepID=UPI002254BBDF|nr:trypsin-like peptidase domain-containing protein [Streptomyces sp. NBC_00038]MCX5560534.1 trypsin-like peptidase domain-containing protein [Streptomyces sp. NBC_00038]